ncbi:hypothetical protein D3C74_338970 [compost metagenome]
MVYLSVRNVPVRLTDMVRSQSLRLSSSIGPTAPLMPALANTISRLPKCSIVFRTASSIRAASEVSTSMASAQSLRSLFSFCSSTEVRSFTRSKRATLAPSRAIWMAVARPIPEPAPVIMAVLPTNRCFLAIFGLICTLSFHIVQIHGSVSRLPKCTLFIITLCKSCTKMRLLFFIIF